MTFGSQLANSQFQVFLVLLQGSGDHRQIPQKMINCNRVFMHKLFQTFVPKASKAMVWIDRVTKYPI